MRTQEVQPRLVVLVQDAILADIAAGKLPPGTRIAEDRIARDLGVAPRPVHQAVLVLRRLGVLCDASGEGLEVAPMNADHVRDMFEVRAVLEGLAFRQAALRNANRAATEGPSYIAAGRRAEASGQVADMIEADMAFHDFIYALSGNQLIAPAVEAHWTDLQRVMGDALMPGSHPGDLWDQHEAMLWAVATGDADDAERLARAHVQCSGEATLDRLHGARRHA
ncbi:GntR family transcriptional regulator [Caenimonas sedimenti]|uniref:GntR family transcriptional regulator n=1 Tax=Caenimonas sedimenti TaxID=2596921 RepID=A0A562ZXS8_9BURK|nr:GntR family transcriptional regulator [Caenimonas sedimenti]TWO73181.1 GntR family transcriptional regulator [Caenimonas sedimenti]